MTEAEGVDAHGPATPSADTEAALLASLEPLRAAGAERLDPVHFTYLEILARRMQVAPEAIRPVLRAKLQRAIADSAARLEQARTVSPRDPSGEDDAPGLTATRQAGGTSLGQLNDYLRSAALDAAGSGEDAAQAGAVDLSRDLKSAERFRLAWSRFHAEDEVDQAIGRGPEDAGPLNSHGLLLRTLTLMRELSPDYLQRFLSQADAWLWLEQARGRLAPPATQTGARRRGQAKV